VTHYVNICFSNALNHFKETVIGINQYSRNFYDLIVANRFF